MLGKNGEGISTASPAEYPELLAKGRLDTTSDFESWYKENKSIYVAKHGNDSEAMRADALAVYKEIKESTSK